MRMVRAGERPSAAAAAWSEVVLNGVWTGPLRVFFSTAVTVAVFAALAASNAAFATFSSLNLAVAWAALNGAPPRVAISALMTQ